MSTELMIRRRRYYGRQTRPLSILSRELIKDFLPSLRVDIEPHSFDVPASLFPHNPSKLVLEIGFGGGEHLVEQARRAPQAGFIGCEPFMNGVSSALRQIKIANHKNIRLVIDDAKLVLKELPDNSLDQVYILFPDPWPKKRHHKRRIINSETLTDLRRTMKPGGILTIATDHEGYQEWIFEHMKNYPIFQEDLKGRSTCYERPEEWIETRYEHKALVEKRQPVYLFYCLQKRL